MHADPDAELVVTLPRVLAVMPTHLTSLSYTCFSESIASFVEVGLHLVYLTNQGTELLTELLVPLVDACKPGSDMAFAAKETLSLDERIAVGERPRGHNLALHTRFTQ